MTLHPEMKRPSTRRRSGVEFWCAALFGCVFVGYPLSVGPVFWMTSALTNQSPTAFGILSLIYLPINLLLSNVGVPDPVLDLYGNYVMWWLALPGGTLVPIGSPP